MKFLYSGHMCILHAWVAAGFANVSICILVSKATGAPPDTETLVGNVYLFCELDLDLDLEQPDVCTLTSYIKHKYGSFHSQKLKPKRHDY